MIPFPRFPLPLTLGAPVSICGTGLARARVERDFLLLGGSTMRAVGGAAPDFFRRRTVFFPPLRAFFCSKKGRQGLGAVVRRHQ
jgi:hypothetical protein